MGKPTGFMEYKRQLPEKRPVEQRVIDFKEIYEPFSETDLQKQAARCMDCGLSLIHISEPTRLVHSSRMPSSA